MWVLRFDDIKWSLTHFNYVEAIYRPSLHLWGLGFGWLGGGEERGRRGGVSCLGMTWLLNGI